ncbi:serine/threonine-protein kinase [Planctomycetota bacterium]
MTDTHSNDRSNTQQPDDAVWDQIAEKVDLLVGRWELHSVGDGPPSIQNLLTDVDVAHQSFVACELIKIDLEYRWSKDHDCAQSLADYVRQLPVLKGVSSLPADLIYEDVQIRLQAGDQVDINKLVELFPKQADDLRRLVGSSVALGAPSQLLNESFRNQQTLDRGSSFEAETSLVGDNSLKSASCEALCEGDSIDDFDLLLLLGSGSFARVFLARQRSLERLVALKISKDVGSEPRTLAQLDHPNIVRVFDVRSCRQPVARLLYMELVPGGTLQDVIQELKGKATDERTGRFILDVVDSNLAGSSVAPPEGSEIRRALASASWHRAVCLIGVRLANGLAYAHEKGVLHRDIKPANVLLTPEGSPKLADFNISFQGGRADENPEDAFGGSMVYMSPEQLAACHPTLGGSPAKVRHPSDIYSLGVLLWELATGERPFDDVAIPSTGWALSIQRMIDERNNVDLEERIAKLSPRLPESLTQVLRRSLQAAPADRYQSATQMTTALNLCLHPRCWKLLQPPRSWITNLPCRFPVMAILLATLIPSVFAAIFNFIYNDGMIDESLGDSGRRILMQVQSVINLIAFPIGMSLVVWVAKLETSLLRKPPSTERSTEPARANLFRLGSVMALIAVSLWVAAGFAYPISFEFLIEGGVPGHVYVHFILSLALCGILAGTYPFFLVTAVNIRWILPELIRRELVSGPRQEDVSRLRTVNRRFVVLTALVPLLGILLILIARQSSTDSLPQRDMIIASLTGIIGFAGMFWVHREIDEDLAALEQLRFET